MENAGICVAINNILRPHRNFLVYFVIIWYIFPVLVCRTKKNLATLDNTPLRSYYLEE
jgi:hypothetical protein